MKNKAFCAAACLCFVLFGQAQPWSISLTVGLNSPLVDDADQTIRAKVIINEQGESELGTVETKGTLLMPPIRLSTGYQINQRFSLGASLIAQAHREVEIFRDAQNEYISESTPTNRVAYILMVEATYKWYDAEKFSLVSGLGLGYGYATYYDKAFNSTTSFCFDTRPISVYYKLCCGWQLSLDTRYTSSPTGLDNIAGYSIGLGVIYSFDKN
jgi:long-subunit fatty acid transport protein